MNYSIFVRRIKCKCLLVCLDFNIFLICSLYDIIFLFIVGFGFFFSFNMC